MAKQVGAGKPKPHTVPAGSFRRRAVLAIIRAGLVFQSVSLSILGIKCKRLSLYFEAVMGKSSFYINGYKVKEHFGGFLSVSIDLTAVGVRPGDEGNRCRMC